MNGPDPRLYSSRVGQAKPVRASYLVDLGICVAFTIVIAVMLNTQGDHVKDALSAGEYSGNYVIFVNIWAPMFAVSLLSHLYLRASLGQYFCKKVVERQDGTPPGFIRLAEAVLLRQVPGVFLVATNVVVHVFFNGWTMGAFVFVIFALPLIWLLWTDVNAPYRLAGLKVVDR